MKKVKVIRKFTDGTIEESFVTIEKKSTKKVSNSRKSKATKDDEISDSQKDEQESSE